MAMIDTKKIYYLFLFTFFVFHTTFGQPFEKVESIQGLVPGIVDGTAIWGDYDNDGDFDFLVSGNAEPGSVTEIFRNDGDDNFVSINAGLLPLSQSTASWTDFDNDNDLDLLLSGIEDENFPDDPVTLLYENINNSNFQMLPTEIDGVANGCSDWADYDNDGDLDLLLSGNRGVHGYTKIYRNEADGTFVKTDIFLEQILLGEARWGDYDNDGDPDILMCGNYKNQQGQPDKYAAVYRNDGAGQFINILADLTPIDHCNATWADYDADGDLDVLTNGSTNGLTHMVYILQNLGNDYFFTIGIEIFGTVDGSISWGDYDNDGDLDFLINGLTSVGDQIITEVYRNINFGLFSKDDQINLIPLHHSSSAWADYDRDGDLDLLMTGNEESAGDRKVTVLYKNVNALVNHIPQSPAYLNSTVNGNSVVLKWERGNDNETPQLNLTYNLRLGTSPGLGDIISPLSMENDFRLISGMGNVFQSLEIEIDNLDPGTYYWSVQCVDNSYDVSPFANEETFVVTSQTGLSNQAVNSNEICCFPNPFSNQTSFILPTTGAALAKEIVIVITDIHGKTINKISQMDNWIWDGYNQAGERQKPGVYFWNMWGNKNEKGKIVFTNN